MLSIKKFQFKFVYDMYVRRVLIVMAHMNYTCEVPVLQDDFIISLTLFPASWCAGNCWNNPCEEKLCCWNTVKCLLAANVAYFPPHQMGMQMPTQNVAPPTPPPQRPADNNTPPVSKAAAAASGPPRW